MGSITLDWTTFALEILNFLVLLWLLKRFLYGPISGAIARRRAQIEQTLAEGRQAKAKADALERQYQGRLEDWEREKADARAQLGRDLEKERSRRLAELAASVERERLRREAAAARDAEQRRRELQHSALRQGSAFAARLAGRLAGPELEARIIDVAISDLRQLPQERRDALHAAAAQTRDPSTAIGSAYPIAQPQREQLVAALNEAAAARLDPVFAVDPALVSGIRIELGAWILAANLRDELAAFADSGNDAA